MINIISSRRKSMTSYQDDKKTGTTVYLIDQLWDNWSVGRVFKIRDGDLISRPD